MDTREQKNIIIENMVDLLELPASAYEKAKGRYDDLGDWFGRGDSTIKNNNPHIFPQGSFRLGTAIRPLDEKDAYDLDLACNLRKGVSKDSHSQEALKRLVGSEIERYRVARGIKAPQKEKHRCWRLDYQDDLSFHLDIVPCIPADNMKQTFIRESMRKAGSNESLAGTVSQFTVSITDDRHPEYKAICDDWNISNPEGYARWFESRMNPILHQRVVAKAQVDDVPIYKKKTPLQRAIQLLKRHRDLMFKDDIDLKPISIIITTLAAKAYHGESDVESALKNILAKMGSFVGTAKPRVPNPVNPAEDFADRWSNTHLNLEHNFWLWLKQVQDDFDLLDSPTDVATITEQAREKFSVGLNTAELSKRLGVIVPYVSVSTPKIHIISNTPPKPWASGF
jgi:hypothetical protein